MYKSMDFASTFARSKRNEENCLPSDPMFGLAVRKVVLSMLTKLRRDSTLENDVDGARYISIFRSSDFSG